jgi:hypothetical protein
VRYDDDDDDDDGGGGGGGGDYDYGAGENGSFEQVSKKLRENGTTEEDIAQVLVARSIQKSKSGER